VVFVFHLHHYPPEKLVCSIMLPSEFKAIKALAETLRGSSSAIQKVIQENTETIQAANESEEQREEIRQEWRDRILAEYKEAERNKAASDDRQYRVQNSPLLFQLGTGDVHRGEPAPGGTVRQARS
jgi:hypothetical protein